MVFVCSTTAGFLGSNIYIFLFFFLRRREKKERMTSAD